MEQSRPTVPKLPAGLAGVLNAPEERRDSAYFSSADASSKHNSTASYSGVNVPSPLSGAFSSSTGDKTPSPTTSNSFPRAVMTPSTTGMSVASIMSPATPSGIDPRRYELAPLATTSALDPRDSLTRRDSVDSRINHDFNGMRLAGSPYASHNQSTTSIHSNLQQQRNPRSGLDSISAHRISNGYQPQHERNPDPHGKSLVRTAPTITGPATGNIARAAEPTKGQAWAFPEEDLQRIPQSSAASFNDSRRSSLADSLASSHYTAESRLPHGQRRLDQIHAPSDYHRMSQASNEYMGVHHHSLQHKHVSDLQDDEMEDMHSGAQPYSRTPELRVSHKIAERKRRTEMKELFDQLRDLMPQERGPKASKWEILTKAIAEHQRQGDTIKYLHQERHSAVSEMEMMRRELNSLRVENSQLRAEPGSFSAVQQSNAAPGGSVARDDFARNGSRPDLRPELPPLRSLHPNGPAPALASESMIGVQYDQRPSGYRGPDRF